LPEMTTTDDVSRYCEIKDEETLRAVVAHWQKVLRLQDWHIDALFVSASELPNPEALASISTLPERKAAQMRMLKPEELRVIVERDYGRHHYPRAKMEHLVVHEILHVHMRTLNLPDSEASELAEEQMVDALAAALTGLHSYFAEAE
jgi:hypothetical protein